MKLLLPLLLALLGAGAGVGAGLYLKPPAQDDAAGAEQGDAAGGEQGDAANTETGPQTADETEPTTAPMPDRDRPPLEERDFVRINNQFVVPVLDDGQVNALVVLSISLETRSGIRDVVFAREPKLRDALLQVLFDHANAGGFSGNFTSADQIAVLRRSMWEAARPILGADVFDVLITDIARQDN
ncbi:MAG: flagellar basal body-associated FliL family protein [Pseudomonadota bacterium]